MRKARLIVMNNIYRGDTAIENVLNYVISSPFADLDEMLALRKILCKKESKQIRKQIMNEVFRLENGRIHLPVLTARSMLYDGMRTAGVNNGIRHRAY